MDNKVSIRGVGRWTALAVLLVVGASLAAANHCRAEEKPASQIEEFATEGGAKCKVALPPDKWNGKLYLIAHGYVPEGRPLLVALKLDDPVYRKLLDAGWIVAATSYRRNSMILSDAVKDVEALRAQVAAKHGKPETVIVEGTSMGGGIGAIIAENPPDPSYKGVLGLGAALEIKDAGAHPAQLERTPKLPVLFLSTQDEIAGPTEYAEQAGTAKATDARIAPVGVWVAARYGHVNLNRQEVGAALDALLTLVDGGKIELVKDGTLPIAPHPSTVIISADPPSATGKVIEVDPVYGNLTIDFQPDDIAKLGLKRGDMATVRIGAADAKSERIFLGSTFNDVPQGQWVCFPTADGYTMVCRNFADAAASAGAKVGSAVTLSKQ